MEHRMRMNFHYLYRTNAVNLITQHDPNFLEKFSEVLYMKYYELLVPLLHPLDE